MEAQTLSDVITLSNSKLKCYRRCPKQFYFKYVRKVEPKRKAIQLKRGDWLHQMLMAHYDGEDWKARHGELSAAFEDLWDEEKEEYGDLPAETERIMKSYFQHWHKEDKGWKVVETEMDQMVELPNGDMFRFIIDLVAEESDGGIWLWDHKTVKSFMPESFMLIDTQLARYFWCARKLGIKNLRGVMFNEVITQAPTLPDVLQSGGLSKRKNIRCDVYTYYRYILEKGLNPEGYKDILGHLKAQSDRWFRRTRLPRDEDLMKQMIKEAIWTSKDIKRAVKEERFPRNAEKGCSWGCDYLDPCTIELMGGDVDAVLDMRYVERGKEEELSEW